MRRYRKKGRGLWAGVILCLLAAGFWWENSREQMTPSVLSAATEDADVTVWYYDCGQANASLVESDGHFMLIDTGVYQDVKKLQQFLKDAGVKRLDYVIGSHPHADHVGSLATIIREYGIETLLMPDVTLDTKTYRVAVEAAAKKELPITHPRVGEVYSLGNVTFQIVAPNGTFYEEINDYSIGLRLTCENTDFLWTGDAQAVSEEEMLKNGYSLEAEVYHVGHHGSYTSSGMEFLEAVQPEAAVISCGSENEYGYPHEEVLQNLSRVGAKVYTTAECGTIKVSCRNDALIWETEKEKEG